MTRILLLPVAVMLACLPDLRAQTVGSPQVHPIVINPAPVVNTNHLPAQNPVRIRVPRVNVQPVGPGNFIDRNYVYQYPNGYVPNTPLITLRRSPVPQPQSLSPDRDPADHLNGVLLSRVPRVQANQLNFPARSDVRYTDRLVADVQQNLRRLGYYSGMVDGILGPGTETAIQRYQVDHRQPVTGLLDRAMLSQLGVVTR
jgi:hypothetical protein